MDMFYEKFKDEIEWGDMTKVKIIHKKVEKAQHLLKKDKNSREALCALAKAGEMIDAFFEEKQINPTTLL